MSSQIQSGKFRTTVFALLAGVLALPGAAFSQQHGGHEGVRGGGGHEAAGGFRGGVSRSAVAYRGGPVARYGYAGRYGYGRGYYGGRYYRPGYYRGWYGGGFYGALALGAFVATLPLYYSTFWWGGVPYYYYDDTYYRWNDGVSQYEVVAPPTGAPDASSDSSGGSPAGGGDVFAYPKNGQSEEQQNTDKYECHSWAVKQSGFDPTGGAPGASHQRDDYMRAQAACLEGRGYSVQ